MDYGSGKCLVFLHGWGGEIASFRALADKLSERFRVILIDLYGFGKTPHPDHPLTIEDYARGVRGVLDRAEVTDCVPVGHSFGGRIAMRLAANDPIVSGVVLLDSAGVIPRRGLRYYGKVALYKIGKKLKLASLPKGSADYAALSGVMKKTFVNVVNESSEPDAMKIRVPTLLIWGSEDEDTPLYMCRRLKKRISDSECIVIEGAGHFAYLEHPEYVRRVLTAFREGI